MCSTGRRYDFCAQGPCYHNGVCVQTSQEPGYKCRCAGTGYYGARCEISKTFFLPVITVKYDGMIIIL